MKKTNKKEIISHCRPYDKEGRKRRNEIRLKEERNIKQTRTVDFLAMYEEEYTDTTN